MLTVRLRTVRHLLWALVFLMALGLAPKMALAVGTTPQANTPLPSSPVTGTLSAGKTVTYDLSFSMVDWADYYFRCWIYGPDGSKINVHILDDGDPLIGSLVQAYPDGFSYTPPAGYPPSQWHTVDTYQIQISCEEGPGDYTLYWEIRDRREGLIDRIAGGTRIQTSVLCSQKGFPYGASTVLIATGFNWPDALSASGLAGAVRGPVLLTHSGYLDADILTEIRRLGASKAYVIGGTGAVSDQVMIALQNELGASLVTRIDGATRYSTSAAVAREIKAFMSSRGRSIDSWAHISTGANYPDALAIGPIAAAFASPVILEPPSGGGLSDGTRSLLAELGSTGAIVLGGSGAVSEAKFLDLADMLGTERVGRLGGATRYETAAIVADYGVALGLNPDGAAIAKGTGYADALSAAMMQASSTSVLLLALPDGRLGEPSSAFLRDIGPVYLTHARVVGGHGGAFLEMEIAQALAGF